MQAEAGIATADATSMATTPVVDCSTHCSNAQNYSTMSGNIASLHGWLLQLRRPSKIQYKTDRLHTTPHMATRYPNTAITHNAPPHIGTAVWSHPAKTCLKHSTKNDKHPQRIISCSQLHAGSSKQTDRHPHHAVLGVFVRCQFLIIQFPSLNSAALHSC
jgi:hypothetical protein